MSGVRQVPAGESRVSSNPQVGSDLRFFRPVAPLFDSTMHQAGANPGSSLQVVRRASSAATAAMSCCMTLASSPCGGEFIEYLWFACPAMRHAWALHLAQYDAGGQGLRGAVGIYAKRQWM